MRLLPLVLAISTPIALCGEDSVTLENAIEGWGNTEIGERLPISPLDLKYSGKLTFHPDSYLVDDSELRKFEITHASPKSLLSKSKNGEGYYPVADYKKHIPSIDQLMGMNYEEIQRIFGNVIELRDSWGDGDLTNTSRDWWGFTLDSKGQLRIVTVFLWLSKPKDGNYRIKNRKIGEGVFSTANQEAGVEQGADGQSATAVGPKPQ